MGKKYLGKDALIYLGTAGTKADGALTNIKDPNLDMSRDKTDITCLSDGDYKSEVATYKNMTFGFSLRIQETDENYGTLWAAYQAGTAVSFLIDNGTHENCVDADFVIDSWGESKPLADGQFAVLSCSQSTDLRVPITNATNVISG